MKHNKAFTQNKNHSRMSLSGISAPLSKQQDPRQQHSGMVKGFTLIELLVVVLIIGILSAIALPQYQVAVKKTKLATIKNLTRSIANAEEIYYMANGTYTINWEELDVTLPDRNHCTDAGTFNQCYFDWGHCFIQKQNIDRAVCHIADVSYAIYFDNAPKYAGQRRCYSIGLDLTTAQARVCKNDTGANAPSDNIEIGSNYRMWIYQP